MKPNSRMLSMLVWMSGMMLCGYAEPPAEYLNARSAPPDWTPLKIDLPAPMFVGTPKDLSSPNLEPVTGQPRKPFLAPKDTKNVALGKTVTSSQTQPRQGEFKQVTDGDKRGSDGSFVELASGTQYIQLDLGAAYQVHAIVLWHYHMEARVYFDVVLQVAADTDFVSGVKTIFNNDHDNSAGLGVGNDKEYIDTAEGKLIDTGGITTRFVRLYSNGNTSNNLNDYIEVEVYGVPAP